MGYFSLYITAQHKAMVRGGTHELNILVIHLSYCLCLFLRNWLAQTAQKFSVSLEPRHGEEVNIRNYFEGADKAQPRRWELPPTSSATARRLAGHLSMWCSTD